MKKVEVIKGEGLLNGRRNGAEINLKRVAAYCRVSTDSEDQLQSYHSQVKYYTDLINENSDWTMAGIYADEAITGTQVDKRLDFQRLINDCMNGDIDMIITKSISRFARNTLDTLKYVRQLKEMNVAVFFEEENIESVVCESNEQAIANIDKQMEEKQMELISYANSGKDYENLADEIQALSERKQTILTEEAESQGEQDRIIEMMEFIEKHADKSLNYDEELVRLLVEKITIFENNVVVRFKSGIEVEV